MIVMSKSQDSRIDLSPFRICALPPREGSVVSPRLWVHQFTFWPWEEMQVLTRRDWPGLPLALQLFLALHALWWRCHSPRKKGAGTGVGCSLNGASAGWWHQLVSYSHADGKHHVALELENPSPHWAEEGWCFCPSWHSYRLLQLWIRSKLYFVFSLSESPCWFLNPYFPYSDLLFILW